MPRLAKVKVLLVEDEPLVAMGIADQLRGEGADVIGPCATTAQAADALRTYQVDVAVIDYVLADGTSDSVQVALEDRNIPFVILSAYPPLLVRRSEQQVILSKPASGDLLCSTVNDLLRQTR